MVVSWICLLLVAGVFTSVNADCPPSNLADYIPYTLLFNISMETTYNIFYGSDAYKEEFHRYFNLLVNHSRISSEDADRIERCLSFNNLTLLTRNGSLMINDESMNGSFLYPVDGNMTFTVHRSLPLQYKEHGDSKWYTSKDAALEVILCGNGDRFTSNVTAYTKVTIPDEVLFGHAGGDHHIDPFVTNHPFSYDVDCCRLEVKLAFILLQDFVDEKYSDGYRIWPWMALASVGLLAIVLIAVVATRKEADAEPEVQPPVVVRFPPNRPEDAEVLLNMPAPPHLDPEQIENSDAEL